ncbi:MAG: hypothetical protein U0Y68_12205 [Blastocatellia bacterium]
MPAQFPVLLWCSAIVVFICALLLAFSWGYHRAQRATLRRVRRRITADLHDDIGANLSQLAILSEVLQRQERGASASLTRSLATLAHIARETGAALNDIVWATNPQQDTLRNLVRRMRRFASELLPPAGIEFSFRCPQRRTELRLEAQLRRQVFLIFKESLNNLARHSGSTRATIDLQIEAGELLLRVTDNGKGFDCQQAGEGNGLPSLSRRAQTLGADFQIHSSPQGTTILLRARLRPQHEMQWRRLWRLWPRLKNYLHWGVTAFPPPPTLPVPSISLGDKNTAGSPK